MRRVSATFHVLHDYVRRHYDPTFHVELRRGDASEFTKKRNMAYCRLDRTGVYIHVAPKMERARQDQIDGVLRHEFGHAVFMLCGRPDHTERQADALAEDLFGAPIYYDRDLIQSTASGQRPRPSILGA
jgi:hypothetical protein